MANIFVYTGGLGDAGIGSPQFIAAVSLLAGAPLMLSATGGLVPNDGTAPIVGFAPIGGVAPSQGFTPIGLDIVNINTAAPYTAGTIYYMQADGSIGSTVSTHYAGTAINSTTLVRVAETAAMVAAANAPALAPGAAITHLDPATQTNKLTTLSSVRGVATIAGTIITATGAAGTVQFYPKAHGLFFELSLTALPANDYSDIFATLPALPAGVVRYLNYIGIFTNQDGQLGGTIQTTNTQMSLIRTAGSTAGSATGMIEYA
jgi:hypothetical protein